jgi:hypothetical protein
MSNRARVIQFLSNIIEERHEDVGIQTFAVQQDAANLRTFAITPHSFSVGEIRLTQVTIEGKGAVTYQIQDPVALVPVIENLTTRIKYHDFPVNENAKTVSSQIKTVESKLFSRTYWQTYLQRLKGGLSANFQTLEVDRGVILKDASNRPIILPSFVYVEITKGPSFFKSAETIARMGVIREGENVYTVTMFPANFAQLARLAFANVTIKQGEKVIPMGPVAAFEEALRRATRAIGEVAKVGGSEEQKRNMAGALMPGTGESVEVARAVALAAFAEKLRNHVKDFKVVQFQIRPDPQGRLRDQDYKALVDNLRYVFGMVLSALEDALNAFTTWANNSIASAQLEALQALSGKAPDVWAAARVSERADINVTFHDIDSPITVSTTANNLKVATANAKPRPLPTLVAGSSLIRAKEGGGAVFSTIADTLLYAMNAIGHNWDLAERVLEAFNQRWQVWDKIPTFFDRTTNKLRPLSAVLTDLAEGLIRKRTALENNPKLEEFENEVTIILHYIDTLYGKNPTLVSLQNIDQDINRLARQPTFQLDPIVRNALDTLRSTINLANIVRFIPTLEVPTSIPTTPWELPIIEEEPETGTETTGFEITLQ